MKKTNLTNKSGILALVVYLVCCVFQTIMTAAYEWPVFVHIITWGLAAIVFYVVFKPECSAKVKSYVFMIGAFITISMCSIMEMDIYPSLVVLVGEAVLLIIYRNEKLILTQMILTLALLCLHIFVFKTVDFNSMSATVAFFVRVGVMLMTEAYIVAFIRNVKASERKLTKAADDARRAENSKSDFLTNMSHEIRTPMNAIVGMCEMILRENDISGSVRENCFNIQTSGRSLLAIINDILDFSKIDSGRMELINEEFNIASTLNDVVNMSLARKGSRNIEIIVDAACDIPRGIIGDELRIRQVIINLMTNAIKFTKSGYVKLSVSSLRQDYGINLLVSVEDTGIGITEENLDKLFTSFQQVDTKKNRSVEGTGLGLAISKKLITNMGGFISVKSTYGVGSEFKFVIPMEVSDDKDFITVKEPEKIHAVIYFAADEYMTGIANSYTGLFDSMAERLKIDMRYYTTIDALKERIAKGEVTHCFISTEEYMNDEKYFEDIKEQTEVFLIQDRVNAIDVPNGIKCIYKPFYSLALVSALNDENMVLNLNERRSSGVRFTAPKARVLIVDDNIINLKVATGLMQPYNMQILTAESGRAAINMLRSKDIDIVFMDHMMPEMDGVEATHIIRNMDGEYYKKLPIIALTANAVNGVKNMFIKEGLNDFMAKPIELSALDKMLRNYLPQELIQAPSGNDYSGVERRKSRSQTKKTESEMFDPDKGLMFTGGDVDAYVEILDLYVKKGVEKIKYINDLFEKKDWKNYIIEVHALKSTSLSIGAVKLSELAKELEFAGKTEKYNIIEEKQTELLDMYGEVMETIKEYLGDKFVTENIAPIVPKELTEITKSRVCDFLVRIKQAFWEFDGKAARVIADEARSCSFNGHALCEYFEVAALLAEDYEYDAAEEKISEFEKLVGIEVQQ